MTILGVLYLSVFILALSNTIGAESTLCPIEGRTSLVHPTSCSHFIYCEDGVEHLMECIDGLQFDSYLGHCNDANKVRCKIEGIEKRGNDEDIDQTDGKYHNENADSGNNSKSEEDNENLEIDSVEEFPEPYEHKDTVESTEDLEEIMKWIDEIVKEIIEPEDDEEYFNSEERHRYGVSEKKKETFGIIVQENDEEFETKEYKSTLGPEGNEEIIEGRKVKLDDSKESVDIESTHDFTVTDSEEEKYDNIKFGEEHEDEFGAEVEEDIEEKIIDDRLNGDIEKQVKEPEKETEEDTEEETVERIEDKIEEDTEEDAEEENKQETEEDTEEETEEDTGEDTEEDTEEEIEDKIKEDTEEDAEEEKKEETEEEAEEENKEETEKDTEEEVEEEAQGEAEEETEVDTEEETEEDTEEETEKDIEEEVEEEAQGEADEETEVDTEEETEEDTEEETEEETAEDIEKDMEKQTYAELETEEQTEDDIHEDAKEGIQVDEEYRDEVAENVPDIKGESEEENQDEIEEEAEEEIEEATENEMEKEADQETEEEMEIEKEKAKGVLKIVKNIEEDTEEEAEEEIEEDTAEASNMIEKEKQRFTAILSKAIKEYIEADELCLSSEQKLLPHPYSCAQFIECDNGKYRVINCLNGLHFNRKEGLCDFPDNAGCIDSKLVSPSITETRVNKNNEDGPVGTCPAKSGKLPTYLADSKDCSIFYICGWDQPIEMKCADGLHFNHFLNVCDWPQNAGCTIRQ